jgi:hypothetical protein
MATKAPANAAAKPAAAGPPAANPKPAAATPSAGKPAGGAANPGSQSNLPERSDDVDQHPVEHDQMSPEQQKEQEKRIKDVGQASNNRRRDSRNI